jgi:hypothetical protein
MGNWLQILQIIPRHFAESSKNGVPKVTFRDSLWKFKFSQLKVLMLRYVGVCVFVDILNLTCFPSSGIDQYVSRNEYNLRISANAG